MTAARFNPLGKDSFPWQDEKHKAQWAKELRAGIPCWMQQAMRDEVQWTHADQRTFEANLQAAFEDSFVRNLCAEELAMVLIYRLVNTTGTVRPRMAAKLRKLLGESS